MTIPDSSLLIKAVERLSQPQVTDPPAIFRVQAFKLQHGVDHRPTHDIAVSLAQLFLAELETLSLQPAESKKPRVSALKEDGESDPNSDKGGKGKKGNKGKGSACKSSENQGQTKEVCRQFSSEKGCPRGNTCKYVHQTHTGQPLRLRSRRPKVVLLLPMQKPQFSRPQRPKCRLLDSATQALKDAATSLRQELLKAIRVVGSNPPPEDLGTGGKGLIDGELLVASEPPETFTSGMRPVCLFLSLEMPQGPPAQPERGAEEPDSDSSSPQRRVHSAQKRVVARQGRRVAGFRRRRPPGHWLFVIRARSLELEVTMAQAWAESQTKSPTQGLREL